MRTVGVRTSMRTGPSAFSDMLRMSCAETSLTALIEERLHAAKPKRARRRTLAAPTNRTGIRRWNDDRSNPSDLALIDLQASVSTGSRGAVLQSKTDGREQPSAALVRNDRPKAPERPIRVRSARERIRRESAPPRNPAQEAPHGRGRSVRALRVPAGPSRGRASRRRATGGAGSGLRPSP
jgi:hypothetical protein